MSKMSKKVSEMSADVKLRRDETVTNFMGGDSYVINPVDTLKLIAASSIFGEASYYRTDVKDGRFSWSKEYSDSFMEATFRKYAGKSTTEVFTEAIDAALDYDFGATLDLAAEIRKDYNMRLNPQVIMVRAATHKNRAEFTAKNPGKFAEIEKKVMSRADEPMSQLSYYLYNNKGKKNNIPTILKKSIATKLSSLDAYAVNKYKNHEIGMVNAVRISHANSKVLDELMQTGKVEVSAEQETWEQKRSAGASWEEILKTTKLGHMALLRNLRNIFQDVNDEALLKQSLEDLKKGVAKGKQFPFRYWNAYQMIEKDGSVKHKALILDALEECIDLACDNLPKLKGKTMALSDNSGSAWGAFTSEYGKCTVAEIDNLSSVIAARCSDEGYTGKFGDRLIVKPVSKRNGVLAQAKEMTRGKCDDVGGGTEGGIWEFFDKAIRDKEVYDNIVIFSDQQAGHGGLYGTDYQRRSYGTKYGCGGSWGGSGGHYINVFKLIQDYRKLVNPKVNIMSVQTAGYNNVVIPENAYRCTISQGWTGREIEGLKRTSDFWDSIDSQKQGKRKIVKKSNQQ